MSSVRIGCGAPQGANLRPTLITISSPSEESNRGLRPIPPELTPQCFLQSYLLINISTSKGSDPLKPSPKNTPIRTNFFFLVLYLFIVFVVL